MQFMKAEDNVTLVAGDESIAPCSLDRLLGIWTNTNEAAEEVPTIILEKNDRGRLTVHAAGGNLGPADWGKVEADNLFTLNIHSQDAAGFTACYRFASRETLLQANWNQGLLVVASFNVFKEDSSQSSYFTREFYRREGAK